MMDTHDKEEEVAHEGSADRKSDMNGASPSGTPPPVKRGRWSSSSSSSVEEEPAPGSVEEEKIGEALLPVKRGRGRPRKNKQVDAEKKPPTSEVPTPKRGRGRPRKYNVVELADPAAVSEVNDIKEETNIIEEKKIASLSLERMEVANIDTDTDSDDEVIPLPARLRPPASAPKPAAE